MEKTLINQNFEHKNPFMAFDPMVEFQFMCLEFQSILKLVKSDRLNAIQF